MWIREVKLFITGSCTTHHWCGVIFIYLCTEAWNYVAIAEWSVSTLTGQSLPHDHCNTVTIAPLVKKTQWHNRPTWLEQGPGDFSSSWPLFWGWGQDVNAGNLPTLNLGEGSLRPVSSHTITSQQWKNVDLQGGCITISPSWRLLFQWWLAVALNLTRSHWSPENTWKGSTAQVLYSMRHTQYPIVLWH